MQKIVAVEEGLRTVNKALQEAGYQVVNLNKGNYNEVNCIVVSGMDENLMGMQTRLTNAPVINAKGLTPQEVVEQVKNYQ